MKFLSVAVMAAFLTGIAACREDKAEQVPPGQLSARMIHNPRSAEGVTDAAHLPVLSFADTAHDFGLMGEGEQVEHEFSFKNTGKSALVIAGATSSCGCTVPEYSRKPIPPGGSGNLKVTFSSAGKQGHILKAVTVSSNAFPATKVLTITADVKPASRQ